MVYVFLDNKTSGDIKCCLFKGRRWIAQTQIGNMCLLQRLHFNTIQYKMHIHNKTL